MYKYTAPLWRIKASPLYNTVRTKRKDRKKYQIRTVVLSACSLLSFSQHYPVAPAQTSGATAESENLTFAHQDIRLAYQDVQKQTGCTSTSAIVGCVADDPFHTLPSELLITLLGVTGPIAVKQMMAKPKCRFTRTLISRHLADGALSYSCICPSVTLFILTPSTSATSSENPHTHRRSSIKSVKNTGKK